MSKCDCKRTYPAISQKRPPIELVVCADCGSIIFYWEGEHTPAINDDVCTLLTFYKEAKKRGIYCDQTLDLSKTTRGKGK